MALTSKQSSFCEQYIANGYNGTEAYAIAYETDNRNMASVEATRLLKQKDILDRINEIEGEYRIVGHKLEINKKFIMERILDMMSATKIIYHQGTRIDEVPDNVAINNAIGTYAKLVGDFTEKKEVKFDRKDLSGIDVTKLSEEEKEELRKEIEASL